MVVADRSRKDKAHRFLVLRDVPVTVLLVGLALVGLLSSGCSVKDGVEKHNLTGQLKKINREVEGLNRDTGELVETLAVMDVKEGGLEESKALLILLEGKTQDQVRTSRELADIVGRQRERVATILSIAHEVLEVELGLKEGTERQMGIAGRTLDLVRLLYGNLRAFEGINRDINEKMDRALEIMRNM